MENTVGMLLNATWFFVYLVAFIYNLRYRPDFRPMSFVALSLAIGYAVTQYLSHLAFAGKTFAQQMQFQYLLWAACCAAIAVLIILFHAKNKYRRFWPVKVVLALLVVDAASNLVMHVDQVLMGLNDFGEPNSNWKQDYWWLWTAYSVISNLNNGVYAIVLFVPVSFAGGIVNKLIRQITADIQRLMSFSLLKPTSVYSRLSVVLDLVNSMPNGPEKTAAKDALAGSIELMARQDETGLNFECSAHMLISVAAEIALRTDTNIKVRRPAAAASLHI